MPFTSVAFDRRLAALERAEAGRSGRPLGSLAFAKVALARRLSSSDRFADADPALVCRGPALLLQR